MLKLRAVRSLVIIPVIAALGNTTSLVEITNISPHGIWMLRQDEEIFLSYQDFPWF